MATPSTTGGSPRAATASPLATQRASTVPGNRRRAANGKVCSKASAYAKASVRRGQPPPTGPFSKTNKAVLKAAATNASPLSNTHGLPDSRRNHRAPLSIS
jgi:hypothetical protein